MVLITYRRFTPTATLFIDFSETQGSLLVSLSTLEDSALMGWWNYLLRQHPAGLGCHPTRYSICLNWCQYIGPFPHRQDARVQKPRAGDENGPFRDFPGGPVGLRLHASNAGGSNSTPGWRTKISHFTRPKKKKEKKRTLSRNILAEVKENREWKV